MHYFLCVPVPFAAHSDEWVAKSHRRGTRRKCTGVPHDLAINDSCLIMSFFIRKFDILSAD